jgi:ABC-type Fe3+ transport system permease subunit
VALLAPFWVSYMMRMLAWVNLLESDGMVNRLLVGSGCCASRSRGWPASPVTVTLGLVYGYIPYMVLALYAGLDRVDQRLLEAARDLGASRRRTFLLVTLPLSRQAILAGLVVTALPMFGDYFTNDLLSGSPRTSMVGNLVNDAIGSPGQGGQAAALVLVMIALLAVPDARLHPLHRAGRPGRGAVSDGETLADRPVAQATAAGGAGLGLPGLVGPAGGDRRLVLVQRRPLPLQLAGLLAALVLAGPGAVGLARPRPPAGPAPQPPPGRAHHPGRGAPGGRLRHRPRPLARPLAAGFNFQMLLSFVLPEILLAVALLFLFTNLLKAVQLGTTPSCSAWSPSSSPTR